MFTDLRPGEEDNWKDATAEPSIPDWAREATEDELSEWMVEELTEGIEDTGVRAAWITGSTDDDESTIPQLTHDNPFDAYARNGKQFLRVGLALSTGPISVNGSSRQTAANCATDHSFIPQP